MSRKYAAVVGLHTDPERCGVARFNAGLALRLGVPVVPLAEKPPRGRLLFSLKLSEWPMAGLASCVRGHDLIWHDEGHPHVTKAARRVWYARDIGAPSLVESHDKSDAWGDVWLSLGMAHKVGRDIERYRRAVELAWMAGRKPSALWVSSRTHEGEPAVPWRETEAALGDVVPTVHLGDVSDAGLGLVWPHVTLFVAFFPVGLQANHTSVHAALEAHVPVLTNWGEHTPDDLKDCTRNLDDMDRWLTSWPNPYDGSPYTWERVMEALK